MKLLQASTPLVIVTLAAFAVSSALAQQKTPPPIQAMQSTSVQQSKPPKRAAVPILGSATLLIIRPSRAAQVAQTKMSRDFEAALELGEKALSSGRSDKATSAFQLARQIEPYNGFAIQKLAEAYTANQQLGQALATYRSLIYPGPGQDWSSSNQVSSTVLMNYSLLLLQTGQEQEALAVYNRALAALNYDQGKPTLEVLVPEIGPHGLPYTPQLLQAMACLGIGIDTPGFDGPRLKEAVILAPDSAVANFYLGKYLYARTEPGARSALEKAIQRGDDKTMEAARKYLQFCR